MSDRKESAVAFENSQRVFGLDLLRAYAIFCVVYGHGYALLHPFVSGAAYKSPVIDGVSVFFVLSGFLIGRILLRTLNVTEFDLRELVNFWVRRWFRTLPTYALVLCLLVLIWKLQQRPLPDDWPKYFAFLQNFASVHPDFFPEAWSLSVEEWFYLLTPVALLLACKFGMSKRTSALALIVTVIVVVTAFRAWRAYGMGELDVGGWDIHLKKQVVTRLDSLMYGVLGAYLSLAMQEQWNRYRSGAFIGGVCLLLVEKAFTVGGQGSPYLSYLSLTVLPVGTLLTLPLLSCWRIEGRGGHFARAVTLVSVTSYSMYLIHFTIVLHEVVPITAVRLAASGAGSLTVALLCYLAYWLLSLGAAYVLWRYFERPMTSLRERFRSRQFANVRPLEKSAHEGSIGT